jgi:hypothetical protein
MAHFDFLKSENHWIFKPRQHGRLALTGTHPEAARVGNG